MISFRSQSRVHLTFWVRAIHSGFGGPRNLVFGNGEAYGEMDIVIPDRIRLVDLVGRPARRGAFLFVPALFDNSEWMHPSEEYALSAWIKEQCLVVPDVWYGEAMARQFNGLWVRARLPIVFGFAPPTEPGKSEWLLECPFLAISETRGRYEIIAFVLSDIGLDPGLEFFRDTGPTTATQIASEFWDLLLAEPHELASFRTELRMEYDQDGSCPVEVGYWGGSFRVYYSIDPLTCQPM